MVCGHLKPDLATLADELLMAPAQEAERAPDAQEHVHDAQAPDGRAQQVLVEV